MLLQFKKIITPPNGVPLTPKLITFDGTYSIITPVRSIFSNSKLLLVNWHINQHLRRHVSAFSLRRECSYTAGEVKGAMYALLNSRSVKDFYQSRDATENKYFGTYHVLRRATSIRRYLHTGSAWMVSGDGDIDGQSEEDAFAT